jgi:hypothetical protein
MVDNTDKVDFSGLVAGLGTSAMAVLTQVGILMEGGAAAVQPGDTESEPLSEEERAKRIGDGLGGARQLIDTLAMLEQKTEGNLDETEKSLLESTLSELRIAYVALANRPAAKRGENEGTE